MAIAPHQHFPSLASMNRDVANWVDEVARLVEGERGAETTGADAKNAGCLEALLALHAHLGQDQVARVADSLV